MARISQSGNQFTPGAWAGDYTGREHNLPGGARVDGAQWATVTYTVKMSAAALAAAVSLDVDALPVAIPAGTILDFAGTGELAKVTANAAKGAVALTVEALDAAIEDDDEASYVVTDASPVSIPSGTLVGRTYAEQAAGTDFGPADAADEEIYFIINDVYDASVNPDVELYRPGSLVKYNFLPGTSWADMAAGLKTKVRALYTCIAGQP